MVLLNLSLEGKFLSKIYLDLMTELLQSFTLSLQSFMLLVEHSVHMLALAKSAHIWNTPLYVKRYISLAMTLNYVLLTYKQPAKYVNAPKTRN